MITFDAIFRTNQSCMNKQILLLLLALLPVCGCTEKTVLVEKVTVEPQEITLEAGQKTTLTAIVTPQNSSFSEVTWTSENTNVASVDENGVVTACAAGQARIQAKCGSPARKGLCVVTVTKKAEPEQGGDDGGEGDEGGEGEEQGGEVITGLTKAEAESMRLEVIGAWKESEMSKVKAIDDQTYVYKDENGKKWTYRQVTDEDGHVMKFLMDTYGEKPEGGYSLWISLHGGGACTTEENDGQWTNQQVMYQYANPKQPEEGIYVSPRSYKEAADMWYFRGNDNLFRQIIETMVILHDVNPDRVYLLGYSAGGDGLWRMAPRLADHWAAASMMAGHPGNTRFENLRNLPFMMWVGSKDSAYDRNTLVPKASRKIDELQAADQGGYIHELHVQQGRPHWMELDDAAAFPWMAQYTRNPYPKKIVWRQENEEKKMPEAFFYWLKVADKHITARSDDDYPNASAERKVYLGKELTAEIDGNTINVSKCDYSKFTIYLNDEMVDLDKEVTVIVKGNVVFKGMVERSAEVLRRSIAERNDPSYCFPAEIVVEVK